MQRGADFHLHPSPIKKLYSTNLTGNFNLEGCCFWPQAFTEGTTTAPERQIPETPAARELLLCMHSFIWTQNQHSTMSSGHLSPNQQNSSFSLSANRGFTVFYSQFYLLLFFTFLQPNKAALSRKCEETTAESVTGRREALKLSSSKFQRH